MLKQRYEIVHVGPDRLRIGPWRGDPRMAFITPIGGVPPSPATVDRCLELLADQGYSSVLTSALSAPEQPPFMHAGFTVHEELHLLRNAQASMPAPPTVTPPSRLRRGHPFDLDAVLELDGRAFDSFWRLDRAGLRDARRATPTSRFRVAEHHGVVGYAITGRAGPIGYLQRLAVDPGHQQRGLGTALVVDALRWARRRGAASMLVNTQISNGAALALYERLGFVREPQGLAVLERPLWVEVPS